MPAQVIFPQVLSVTRKYVDDYVHPIPPLKKIDVRNPPFYGRAVERIRPIVESSTAQPDAPEVPVYETGRGPGSTAEVDFWTSREVREVLHSHVNCVVADTKVWEESAAYYIDTHPGVHSFVKNAGLGFAISYFHNGEPHDYVPDFIIRLKAKVLPFLILETKGFDELAEVKQKAAERWVRAVNADGKYGQWFYTMVGHPGRVRAAIDEAIAKLDRCKPE
jgi:type III restriction enzyme